MGGEPGPAPVERIARHSWCDMDTTPGNFLVADDAVAVTETAEVDVAVGHAAVAVEAWGEDPAEALVGVVVKMAEGQNSGGPRGYTAAAARPEPADPAAADGHSLCRSSSSDPSC